MVYVKQGKPTIITKKILKKLYEGYEIKKVTLYKMKDVSIEELDTEGFKAYDNFLAFMKAHQLIRVECNEDNKTIIAQKNVGDKDNVILTLELNL